MAFFGGLTVNLVFHRLTGFVERMALHTGGIGIRFVQLWRAMSRSAPIVRVIIPNMLHAADFRKNRAEHAIISVANVTALIAEIAILAMDRGQRSALRIGCVIGMNGHGMARRAELSFRGDLEIGDVASHRSGNGQRSQTDEEPQFDDAGQGRFSNEEDDENGGREERQT